MSKVSKIPTVGMSKEEWLENRKRTVGGSEISAVMGLNPWESAYSLWANKLGKTPDFEGNTATRVGTKMEQVVAELFEEESGLKVRKTNFIYYHDDFPWQHASPDRMVVGRDAGLEIKTTSAFNGKSFHGEEFPATYYCQCVQYMAITELPEWFLAVLIGNNDFRIYHLKRDESIKTPDWCRASVVIPYTEMTALRDAANDFMKHVTDGTPPEADGSEATTKAIGEIYPQSDGSEITLFGLEACATEYTILSEEIEKLKNRQEELKNVMCAEMGDAEKATIGDHKITWKTQIRKTFDSKAAIADMPELAKYQKESVSRPFRFK